MRGGESGEEKRTVLYRVSGSLIGFYWGVNRFYWILRDLMVFYGLLSFLTSLLKTFFKPEFGLLA